VSPFGGCLVCSSESQNKYLYCGSAIRIQYVLVNISYTNSNTNAQGDD